MQKKTYPNISLTCKLQEDKELTSDKCLSGVISKTKEGALFEEAVKKSGEKRNPFLFRGKHCTLTHRKDGRYQINMKPLIASAVSKPLDLVTDIYTDIVKAIDFIK